MGHGTSGINEIVQYPILPKMVSFIVKYSFIENLLRFCGTLRGITTISDCFDLSCSGNSEITYMQQMCRKLLSVSRAGLNLENIHTGFHRHSKIPTHREIARNRLSVSSIKLILGLPFINKILGTLPRFHDLGRVWRRMNKNRGGNFSPPATTTGGSLPDFPINLM